MRCTRVSLITSVDFGSSGTEARPPANGSSENRPLTYRLWTFRRRRPDDDPLVKSRQDAAGKLGFILGIVAAVCGDHDDFHADPRPVGGFPAAAFAVLTAALNIPLWIALGLVAEKWTLPTPRESLSS